MKNEYINRFNWNYINSVYVPKCENPIKLASGELVPCGHCFHCQSKLKNEWITRLFCEEKYYSVDKKCFLTLTLNDENVNDCSYRDIQLFLKKFRIFLKRKYNIEKIKYFGCFERGEKGNRPHFHLILFGVNPQFLKENLGKSYVEINDWFHKRFWSKGFVKLEKYDYNSIFYVAGYVLKKKLTGYSEKKLYDSWKTYNQFNKWSRSDQEAGFIRSAYYFGSQGLGLRFLLDNIKKVISKRKICLAGKLYKIPRYFVKKIKELFDLDIYEDIKDPFQEKELNPLLTEFLKNDIIINSERFASKEVAFHSAFVDFIKDYWKVVGFNMRKELLFKMRR